MASVATVKAGLISATDKFSSNLQLVSFVGKTAASGGATFPWVSARELSITWGNDPRYWRWLSLERDIDVEVAQLLDVCWLELKGIIPMKSLTKGYKYSIIFVLMMLDPSGFEPKATFSLSLPNGDKEKTLLSLAAIEPKKWSYLKVGELSATGEDGDIIFSLTDKDTLNWKKGLIVGGVLFQPVA